MDKELRKLADEAEELLTDVPYELTKIRFPLPYLSAMLKKDAHKYPATEETRKNSRDFLAAAGYNPANTDAALRRLHEFVSTYKDTEP